MSPALPGLPVRKVTGVIESFQEAAGEQTYLLGWMQGYVMVTYSVTW